MTNETDRPSSTSTHTRIIALGLFLVLIGTSVAGLSHLAIGTGPESSASETKVTHGPEQPDTHHKSDDPRLPSWANLIREAQRFQFDLSTVTALPETTPPQNTREALRLTKFGSATVMLVAYKATKRSERYCLRDMGEGTYYALTQPRTGLRAPIAPTSNRRLIDTVMALGRGPCDYSDGDILTNSATVVEGEALMAQIEPHYDDIASEEAAPEPLIENLSGTNKRLALATTNAANAVNRSAPDPSMRPFTLTRTSLKRIGYTLPSGVTIGYYDNRQAIGYRLCLTNGTEEAVYENTPARQKIIRHALGTCTP
jgi:hypothetical protein